MRRRLRDMLRRLTGHSEHPEVPAALAEWLLASYEHDGRLNTPD